mmetsp:Transcript_42282/g.61766  ORF Transcript_42282/g.61766 Transcript_42282/m.61766 type:complete len:105 (-) Transcript_42282:54-368(-)
MFWLGVNAGYTNDFLKGFLLVLFSGKKTMHGTHTACTFTHGENEKTRRVKLPSIIRDSKTNAANVERWYISTQQLNASSNCFNFYGMVNFCTKSCTESVSHTIP